MIKVKQTKFGNKHGNCLAACLASLLNANINDICTIHDGRNWFKDLNKWLIDTYGLYMVVVRGNYQFPPVGYHMIWGTSPRYKDVDHSVIGYNGKTVFDPHPSNSGLAIKRECVVLVKPL